MNINVNVAPDCKTLGERAADRIAFYIAEAIKEKGHCRIILSTGSSQFETLDALVKKVFDWSKVEMFHPDEYVALPESHVASFRKYLKERFVSKVKLHSAHFVSGEGDVEKNIEELSKLFKEAPIDVGVIGIGENGHVAFNDPPADFETDRIYKVVTLDERCRMQQVGEGWFKTLADVPEKAITMCPKAILSSKHIVTAVPHKVKAEAIYNTITRSVTPEVPATILKTHPDWNLFIDTDSAAKLFSI